MKALLLAAALAAPALAGGQPYWFKFYSTAPYAEIWTGDLVMNDVTIGLPKLVAAIEKSGGKLDQPLKNFVSSATDHSQQLTFSIPQKKAKDAVKAMRKLGTMADPAVRPLGEPIPVEEVRAKIAAIMKEKTDRAAELAKVPAAAAAQEEILEHLQLVEEVAARAQTEVRFNLQVTQK